MGELDFDSLFTTDTDVLFSDLLMEDFGVDEGYWDSILGETESRDLANLEDTGAWQYLLIRLTDERYLDQTQEDFNRFFAENDIAAETRGWLQSAGVLAQFSQAIKQIFNIIVLIIAVVAIIIIMNTLVIAIIERMGEIGTMRAIGAQKKFVRRMVYLETLILAGISGISGIIGGAIVLGVLRMIGLEASNVFFELIYGGKVLQPELSISSVILSIIVILVVGVVSSTYPTSIVMKTSPLKAMESSR